MPSSVPAPRNPTPLPLTESPLTKPQTVQEKKEGYGVTLGGLGSLLTKVKQKADQPVMVDQKPELNHLNVMTEWNHVAQEMAKEKGTSPLAFQETDLELREETIYLFTPLSIIDYVKGKRIYLLDFFKKRFLNENINVLIEEKKLDLSTQPQVASTREVYEEMVKKNPLLQQLKDKLRFDFDF